MHEHRKVSDETKKRKGRYYIFFFFPFNFASLIAYIMRNYSYPRYLSLYERIIDTVDIIDFPELHNFASASVDMAHVRAISVHSRMEQECIEC